MGFKITPTGILSLEQRTLLDKTSQTKVSCFAGYEVLHFSTAFFRINYSLFNVTVHLT